MSIGIDYGMGTSNIDPETGIRYGVISQNSIDPEWWGFANLDYDYADPTCPECGDDIRESTREEDKDYYCQKCEKAQWSDAVSGEEPLGWSYQEDGYQLVPCLGSDICVSKSRYYTYAEFCSPCVPGAGNLDGYNKDGVKTYCLGHKFFRGNKAPYPLYSVKTGKEIVPQPSEEG